MTATPAQAATAQAVLALAEVRTSEALLDLYRKAAAAQRATEATGVWDTPTARANEAVMSHLAMALEAAGVAL